MGFAPNDVTIEPCNSSLPRLLDAGSIILDWTSGIATIYGSDGNGIKWPGGYNQVGFVALEELAVNPTASCVEPYTPSTPTLATRLRTIYLGDLTCRFEMIVESLSVAKNVNVTTLNIQMSTTQFPDFLFDFNISTPTSNFTKVIENPVPGNPNITMEYMYVSETWRSGASKFLDFCCPTHKLFPFLKLIFICAFILKQKFV